MTTALDIYKQHYGMINEPDGAVVLEHANRGGFSDNLSFNKISKRQLEDMGIMATMTREELVKCFKDEIGEAVKNKAVNIFISRTTIQKLINFCTYENIGSQSTPKLDMEDKKVSQTSLIGVIKRMIHKANVSIIDPAADAIVRKVFTGSFRKPKK